MDVSLRHPQTDTSTDKVQRSETKWDYFSDIFGLFKRVYVDGKPIYTRYPVSNLPLVINIKREVTRKLNVAHFFHFKVTHFQHNPLAHSCQQKSIGLKFSKSQTGSDVRYSCHHNSSRFTFPIFAHSCRFPVLHSLQSITPRIY